MRVNIIKADPTGNATILVTTPVAAECRASSAEKLMRISGGWAEQVGFVSRLPDGTPRLDMMGGEFCGNASLSLAAYLAGRSALEETETALSVSGAPGSVRCAVRRSGGDWLGTVTMPLPLAVGEESFPLGGEELAYWTVRLPGMTHVVVPRGELSRQQAEYVIGAWCQRSGGGALGILLLDAAALRMEPLVFVRDTDTAVWERGCASGTAAVGAYLACRSGGAVAADVSQPGGVIGVAARYGERRIQALSITGGVRILDEITVEI